ncbi:MAG: hypothetical protein M0P69_12960 [Bacteroidales bacterium]|nr:hypothetical protein [Bacteroidales bacterium]
MKEQIKQIIRDSHIFTEGVTDTDVFVVVPVNDLAERLEQALAKEKIGDIDVPDLSNDFQNVFLELAYSHYLLAKAEYKRDISFNNEHPAYKAEARVLEYLQEKNPTLYKRLFDFIIDREK